jgi:hypothetical protein
MPITNLNTSASHSSVKVKDEYEAKHEAGVAGKMASVRRSILRNDLTKPAVP